MCSKQKLTQPKPANQNRKLRNAPALSVSWTLRRKAREYDDLRLQSSLTESPLLTCCTGSTLCLVHFVLVYKTSGCFALAYPEHSTPRTPKLLIQTAATTDKELSETK